ncbi:MAG: hypothetical protein EXR35_10485 [Limnohabitans sp.]|nr:hypothetical protein [Limnohabitans sp.]
MRLLFESLQKNYTVYAIDLLGYGRSDRKAIQYTQPIMTDAIRQTAHWIAQQYSNKKSMQLHCLFRANFYSAHALLILTCFNPSH